VLALAAAVVLGIGLRAALPFALARTLESQGQARLGLPVRVGNVDLWVARGAIALEDLTVGRKPEAAAAGAEHREPDPETALLRLRRFFVRIDWRALLERRVHLRELALDAPKVRVERDAEGRIDPLAPPAPAEEPPPEPVPAEPSTPWTFAVDRFDLRELGFQLFDAASQATPVEFALAGLALSDVTFEGSKLGLGGIEIQSPVLRIDRDFALGPRPGGAPEAAAGAGEPKGGEAGAGLAYEVERIGIMDAAFTLRTQPSPLDVTIRLVAEKVNARSGELFPIDLELGIGDGSLSLAGRLGLNPPAYDGRLAWRDLPLPPLGIAARPELAQWVRSCRAAGDLAVELRTTRSGDAGPGLRLAGTAQIRELLVADPSNQEVSVGWRELEVVAREVFVPLAADSGPPGPTRVALERVRLVEPDVLYTLPARAMGELLGGAPAQAAAAPEAAVPAPAGAAEGAEAVPSAPPVELRLDAFELSGGRVRFRDTTVSPPFDAQLRELAVGVADAGFPEPRARSVRATGILAGSASFALEGGLEPDSGDLRFELERLPLPAFDSYTAGAGYRLERGDVSLESALRSRGARAETENRIVLHRLDVSSRDPGDFEKRFGIPLDLALALLRDPAGDIRLDVPVAFDESGVDTGVATIVAGALRQALVGALSSPLKLAGALVPEGGGAEASLAPLEAAPGQARLAPGADARLESLAKLLASRPALGLRLAGRVGPADRPLVAEQILVERALAGEDWPEVEDAGILARRRVRQALAARGRGEESELSPEDQVLLARYVAATPVPPARLQELARRRAAAARDALASQHGVDAARLALGEVAPEGDSGVVVELSVARAR
jgi:hypothetical protein